MLLKSLIYWGGRGKVKRRTIINDYDQGGLKMINIPIFLQFLTFPWIKRLTHGIEATLCGKNIALSEFQKISIGMNIFKCNCNYESLNDIC